MDIANAMNRFDCLFVVTDVIFASNDNHGQHNILYKNREPNSGYFEYLRNAEVEQNIETTGAFKVKKAMEELKVVANEKDKVRKRKLFKKFINSTLRSGVMTKEEWLDIFLQDYEDVSDEKIKDTNAKDEITTQRQPQKLPPKQSHIKSHGQLHQEEVEHNY